MRVWPVLSSTWRPWGRPCILVTVWLATWLAWGLGLLCVVFVYVIFAKSMWVFEAVRFSRSCVLVIDSLWVFCEFREGSQSCLWPKGPISIALNHSLWLSSCVAQEIDCALSVGFRFLLLAFSLKGQSSVSDPARSLRCVWHESHTMTFAPQLITQIFLGGTRLIRSPASRGLLSTSPKYFPVTHVASALQFTPGFHLFMKVFIHFHCDTYLNCDFRNAFLF